MTTGNADSGNALVGNVVLFGRMLRRAGLSVDSDQTRRFVDVLALLGFDRRGDGKAAGGGGFLRGRRQPAGDEGGVRLLLRPHPPPGPPRRAPPPPPQPGR